MCYDVTGAARPVVSYRLLLFENDRIKSQNACMADMPVSQRDQNKNQFKYRTYPDTTSHAGAGAPPTARGGHGHRDGGGPAPRGVPRLRGPSTSPQLASHPRRKRHVCTFTPILRRTATVRRTLGADGFELRDPIEIHTRELRDWSVARLSAPHPRATPHWISLA